MKFTAVSLLALMFSCTAFAAPIASIEVNTNDRSTVVLELLGDELDESEVELLWERGGQQAIHMGDFCFNGNRSEVIQILKLLNEIDFLGDEFRMIQMKLVGKNEIQYQVFDGPNEEVVQEVRVEACS